MTRAEGADPSSQAVVGRPLAALLALLTVFGPISMDLYLPLLPALTLDPGAAASTAQLTTTACLIGLALGQLLAGPASDRFGRRTPLLVGVVAYAATSVRCALSPRVELLVLARFVQGLAGGVGLAISQAAGRDVYSGAALIRYYGRLTVLAGLAAILGPLIGGQLARVTDWRGLFPFLAGIGAVLLIATPAVFRETLPPDRRTAGGLRRTRRDLRRLVADPLVPGAVLITGLLDAALFAHLSGATYVLQRHYGLSPQGCAQAFGLNPLGCMVFGHLAGRLAERWSEHGTLVIGIALCAAGSAGLLATGLLGLPLVGIVVSLPALVTAVSVALDVIAHLTLVRATAPVPQPAGDGALSPAAVG